MVPKPLAQKYQTFAFNCHNPTSIRYLDKDKRCDLNTQRYVKPELRSWDILVHPLKGTLPGHFCKIIKSSITVHCGLWSYNRIVEVPESEASVHISSSQCLSMIQESVYRTPNGQKIQISKNKENLLSFALGRGVPCYGQQGQLLQRLW